jgi:hypothetical protein
MLVAKQQQHLWPVGGETATAAEPASGFLTTGPDRSLSLLGQLLARTQADHFEPAPTKAA